MRSAVPRAGVLISLATALGLAVRTFRLANPQLWADELITYLFTQQPWHTLFGPLAAQDVHPPFVYLLQKVWRVFGDSRVAMRSLPVLLGTLCIPVMYALGRRLLGTRGGVISAFLLTTSPLHVHYSREIRPYPLLSLLALCAVLGLSYLVPVHGSDVLERAPHSPPTWAWLAYLLGATGAFYAQNTAILLPLLATLVVVTCRIMKLVDSRFIWKWCVVNALFVVLISPWLGVLLGHVNGTLKHFWIPWPSLAWVKSQFLGAYPYPWWLKPGFAVIALAGLWSLRKQPVVCVLILSFVVGQPLLLWLISYARPVLIVRALVWPTQISLLLSAAFLARLRAPAAAAAGTAAFVLLQIPALVVDYPANELSSDMSGLVPHLAAFDPQRDVMLFAPQHLERSLRREAPAFDCAHDTFGVMYGDTLPLIPLLYAAQLVDRAKLAAAIGDRPRVWVLGETTPQFPIPYGQDLGQMFAALRARYRTLQHWSSGNTYLELLQRN